MVLGAHVLLHVTEPDFLKKVLLSKKWEKWAKNGQKIAFFKFIRKFSHFFWNLAHSESLYYLLYSCTNPIFKSTIFLEQNDEKAWFFASWYRFMESSSWLKNTGVIIIKNGCGHSVLRTLKLAVSQGKMNEINWFLMCLYKFMKAKSYFNNFLVMVVKNGCGLLGLGTLKSTVLQGPIDEMSWFFVCWYEFRKAKSYYNNY